MLVFGLAQTFPGLQPVLLTRDNKNVQGVAILSKFQENIG